MSLRRGVHVLASRGRLTKWQTRRPKLYNTNSKLTHLRRGATKWPADYVLCHLWQAADEMPLMRMPHRDTLEGLIGGTRIGPV